MGRSPQGSETDAATHERTGRGARAPRQLKLEQRRRAITDAVLKEGSVRIDEIAERFAISMMTAHRDLDALELRGVLRKARGAATALSSSNVESSDVYRAGQELAAKRAIADCALAMIDPGESVLLDDSTTVLQVARRLAERSPLTVITNSLNVITAIQGARGIDLVALGGDYVNWSNSFMGKLTIDAIRALRCDVLVMSTAAVTDGLCFFQSPEAAVVKAAMFESAARRLLLVDHTKFARRALHSSIPLVDFDEVVVDDHVGAETLQQLRKSSTNVVVAEAGRRAE